MRIAVSGEPQRLDAEYRNALNSAAGEPEVDEISRAREMLRAFEDSGAWCSTPAEREAFFSQHPGRREAFYRRYPEQRPVS